VCGIDILRHAVILVRIDHVDQMVRNDSLLLQRRFRRANVHPAVNGHRIERDNLGAESLGQRQRDPRLAGGSYPR
jgi:hypothetical protein